MGKDSSCHIGNILSNNEVNTGRQVTLDYVKFLSIAFMIIIHVYEELSVYPDVDPGILGTIIEFLGGPLAAPVFMFCMGVGIAYSKHSSPSLMLRRGVHLLIFEYVLNFMRDGIREIVFGIVTGNMNWPLLTYNIFCNDILHLAGLTFILLALMKKLNVKSSHILVIAVVMQAVGNFLLRVNITNPVLKYALALVMYTRDASYFPLVMWFIYPVLGLLYGQLLRHVKDVDGFYKMVGGLCITFFIGLRSYIAYSGMGAEQFYSLTDDIYYRQNFLSTLYTVSIIGIVIAAVYFLHKLPWLKRLEPQAVYVGSNLNAIFINQWMVVGIVGFLFEFEIVSWLSYGWILPVAIVVYAVSIALAKYTRVFVKKFL